MNETYPCPHPALRRSTAPGHRAAALALTAVLAAGSAAPAQQSPAPRPAAPAKPPAGASGQPRVIVVPPAQPGALPPAAAGVPDGMIRLDFRGTDIDQVLQAFALAYKWTVVKDPALTGPVTVIESKPLNQEQAFKILQAVLEVRGYTALLDESVLKVMPLKRAITSTTTVRGADGGQGAVSRGQVITEVIPLSNAEAGGVAKDLEPLLTEGAKIIGAAGANAVIITDVASNIERLKRIIRALDRGAGNNELEIFRLKHVNAKQMQEIIENLFKQIAPRAPANPMPMPGQPFQPPQPGQQPRSEARPAVAAVADERTNSVIVVGSAENLKRVEEVVRKLDDELDPHTETRVYSVKFADAQRLAQLVSEALLSKEGNTQNPNQPQPGAFFNPFERRAQGTPSQTSFGAGRTRIVADQRTNTLIITADEDTMQVVERLLMDLDKPVEYETTTFVIPLKNVNADDMAYVLSQAFGSDVGGNNGVNPFFGGFFGGGQQGNESRRDRRIRRRLNNDNQQSSSAGGGPAFASAATGFRPNDPRSALVADASGRPRLPEGAEELAQFFFDPFGRNRGNAQQPETGRNAAGRYVNLLQLRGNVLVTPERNTNSLIITTSPENAEAVKDLVAQLDVETKQVLMEAIVAEVALDSSTKFGIDYLFRDARNKIEGVFPVLPSTGNLGADALASGLRYTILRGNLQAVVTAIGRDERVRILSTPRIFTSNNQEAEIEITDSIPYLQGTTIGFGGQTQTNVDFISVGLILNVTPRITADGMVTVDVYQEDSNLIDFRNVGNNAVAPLTTQRVTDTSVTLKDGDTLVLSGLQKTSRTTAVNKIPILGDIPLIGQLFRSTARQNRRTELVVFLTPRVVNNADEARRIGGQELDRLQKRIPEAKPGLPNGAPFGEPSGTVPPAPGQPARPQPAREPERRREPERGGDPIPGPTLGRRVDPARPEEGLLRRR